MKKINENKRAAFSLKNRVKKEQPTRNGAYTYRDGKVVYLDDVIMSTPEGYYVKHLDGDPFNNLTDNLELRPISELD